MKGVILAAGYGTRFLPITKTIPKEMLPINNRPSLDYIVEEMIESGINDILIVSSRRKKSMEDFFDKEIELQSNIKSEHQKHIQSIRDRYPKVNLYFKRQEVMKGTGACLLEIQSFIDHDFILAFPDDIVVATKPLSKQLIEKYHQYQRCLLAVVNAHDENLSRYGVIEPASQKQIDGIIETKSIVEKPNHEAAPSKYISIGRYLLTREIFPILESLAQSFSAKEFHITNALNILAQKNKLLSYEFIGERFDIGEPLGYLKAISSFAMKSHLRKDYLCFLKKLIQEGSNS